MLGRQMSPTRTSPHARTNEITSNAKVMRRSRRKTKILWQYVHINAQFAKRTLITY